MSKTRHRYGAGCLEALGRRGFGSPQRFRADRVVRRPVRLLGHAALAAAIGASGAAPLAQEAAPRTIPEMWTAWCARCHGADGRGRVAEPTLTVQPRDFTDCRRATTEPDADWALATAKGGPAVGLSAQMPAFGAALTAAQIDGFVAHMRRFCTEPDWPDGNLNLPRPIFTEKAFPEDELVVTPMTTHGGGERHWTGVLTLEKRIGKRAQLEVTQPLESVVVDGRRSRGFGDLELGFKYVLNPRRHNHLAAAGIDVRTPTGSSSEGLGAGEARVEPYLATASAFGLTYVQSQVKLELPRNRPWADRVAVYRVSLGRDLSLTPRAWTVGLELTGENDALALVPQVRKGISPSGALAGAFGVSLPVNHSDEQGRTWVAYVLWEYLEPVFWRRR